MSRGAGSLGIDLGTQSVKVAAVHDGEVVASASRTYRVDSPRPGWAQTDPIVWMRAIDDAVEEVVDQAGTPEGVAISGQMHGVVVVGDDLQPLTPGIIWADGRSSAEAQWISEQAGRSLLARVGSAAFPGFLGPSVSWLVNSEPSLMAKARWALSPKDFIRARLTGSVGSEPSDASGTLLFDVVAGQWDKEMADICSVPMNILPLVQSSTAVAGVITRGLLQGIPVAMGGADTACVVHGLGLRVGDGYLGLGSGSQVVTTLERPMIDETLQTHTFAQVGAPGTGWYRMGAVQSGGLILERALAWLGATVDEAGAALEAGIEPDDPVFVPFLAGERTPFLDPTLRGGWSNLSLGTDRAALLRSVLEGMAFAIAVAFEAMGEEKPKEPLPVLGGGSRDRHYLSLVSSAVGCSMFPLETQDGAVLGAARLAGEMTGASFPGILEESTAVGVVDPVDGDVVQERFRRWRGIVDGILKS